MDVQNRNQDPARLFSQGTTYGTGIQEQNMTSFFLHHMGWRNATSKTDYKTSSLLALNPFSQL